MKMNELMIYQVFPLRALTDGQPSHGILEMIDWIPHIKKLGMNAVYFSPVFSSSDHGYDTKDYQKIDERLGTNEDFKKMCDAMHRAKFKPLWTALFRQQIAVFQSLSRWTISTRHTSRLLTIMTSPLAVSAKHTETLPAQECTFIMT